MRSFVRAFNVYDRIHSRGHDGDHVHSRNRDDGHVNGHDGDHVHNRIHDHDGDDAASHHPQGPC